MHWQLWGAERVIAQWRYRPTRPQIAAALVEARRTRRMAADRRLGWRRWRLEGDCLVSTYYRFAWPSRLVWDEQWDQRKGTGAGLHAFRLHPDWDWRREESDEFDRVRGLVRAHGEMLGDGGVWRAEGAEILALHLPEYLAPCAPALWTRYGVPITLDRTLEDPPDGCPQWDSALTIPAIGPFGCPA